MLSNFHPAHRFDLSNCRKPTGEGADAREPSIRVVLNWHKKFRDREQE